MEMFPVFKFKFVFLMSRVSFEPLDITLDFQIDFLSCTLLLLLLLNQGALKSSLC